MPTNSTVITATANLNDSQIQAQGMQRINKQLFLKVNLKCSRRYSSTQKAKFITWLQNRKSKLVFALWSYNFLSYNSNLILKNIHKANTNFDFLFCNHVMNFAFCVELYLRLHFRFTFRNNCLLILCIPCACICESLRFAVAVITVELVGINYKNVLNLF